MKNNIELLNLIEKTVTSLKPYIINLDKDDNRMRQMLFDVMRPIRDILWQAMDDIGMGEFSSVDISDIIKEYNRLLGWMD